MKSVIVYQAYGQQCIREQNLFSVLSLLKKHQGLTYVERILIYTDLPEYFQSYLGNHPLVEYQYMGPERVKAWRGKIDFVHRLKVEMLRDASKLYPKNNIFYIDGDTYFSKDPSHLFALVNGQNSVMHEAENILEMGKDPLSKKLTRFVKKAEFNIAGKPLKVPASTMMWNAGVLGFSPEFVPELELVLEFTDQSYSQYQKHTMEQLAFSYFLAAKTRIHSAQEYIHHYWRQKDEYNALVKAFLNRTQKLEKGLLEFDQIEWPAPVQPKKSFVKRALEIFTMR